MRSLDDTWKAVTFTVWSKCLGRVDPGLSEKVLQEDFSGVQGQLTHFWFSIGRLTDKLLLQMTHSAAADDQQTDGLSCRLSVSEKHVCFNYTTQLVWLCYSKPAAQLIDKSESQEAADLVRLAVWDEARSEMLKSWFNAREGNS